MYAVGRLVRDNDIRLDRPEESVHLIVGFVLSYTSLISHDISLRYAGCPDSRPAVSAQLQTINLDPVKVQVVIMQRGEFEVHIVISRDAQDLGFLPCVYDVFQYLVLLLHNPAGADSVLLEAGAGRLGFIVDIRAFEEHIYKILNQNILFSHVSPQSVKIRLEFVVADRGIHAVKRYIDQVAGNDVDICSCRVQQCLDLLEVTVNIRCINNSHSCRIGPVFLKIKRSWFIHYTVCFSMFS